MNDDIGTILKKAHDDYFMSLINVCDEKPIMIEAAKQLPNSSLYVFSNVKEGESIIYKNFPLSLKQYFALTIENEEIAWDPIANQFCSGSKRSAIENLKFLRIANPTSVLTTKIDLEDKVQNGEAVIKVYEWGFSRIGNVEDKR